MHKAWKWFRLLSSTGAWQAAIAAVGFTISKDALRAAVSLFDLPRIYHEVLFPTLVHHLGFKISDVGRQSDMFRYVRWGPQWTEEQIRQLISASASCAHPFKDTTRLTGIYQNLCVFSPAKD
jgi:hypothetical protein